MFSTFRRLAVIYKGYRLRLLISQILLLISATTTIMLVTQIQKVIDEGIAVGNTEVIVQTGIWMMVLAMISGLCLAGTAYFAVFFAQGTAFIVRRELYNKIQTFSFENFDQFRTGNLMVRLNADVNNIANAVLYSVILLLYAPFMVLVAFILTVINTPDLVWILVVVVAVVLGIMAWLVPKIDRAYNERQKRLDDVNNRLQENLAGIRVVKAFVREELEKERFAGRAEAMRQPAYEAAFRVAMLNPLLTGIAQIAIACSLWIGGEQVLRGTGLNVGEVVTFTQYLSLVVMPLAIMAIVIPFILRGATSAERVFEVMDAEPAITSQADAQAAEPESIKGQVVFEDVSFAFRRPDGELDPPALKDINLTVNAGERIGILGATGAGKSALVNLIPRFYDVTQGRITIDGTDVRDYELNDLRHIVGIALQEALLFQGDVRFNLKFGAPEADDEVMIDAAKAADAYGFVTNLPEQWDAPVARRGYNFSGGQRQRLGHQPNVNAQTARAHPR